MLTSGIRKIVISYTHRHNGISRAPAARHRGWEGKTNLLLEVPPVLLVDEDEVEVISRAELLVHVAERRREVEATEEEAYWDRLACQSTAL